MIDKCVMLSKYLKITIFCLVIAVHISRIATFARVSRI